MNFPWENPGLVRVPHGYCLSWEPTLLWTLAISDLLIALSYFTIPFALGYFARKRPDIRMSRILWLFGLFIVACGVTHLLEIANIWQPFYWSTAAAKVITAAVSVLTAIVLWQMMPQALRAPSADQLAEANRHLEEARSALEARVQERTEALARSEERLRLVLEGSELGYWDWDISSGQVERNARWAEMLGYSYEEIKHTTAQWTDFIYPEDRQKAWTSISAVLEGRADKHRCEYRMLHKDGSVRWILDQANVVQRDRLGMPNRMCGTHTDITERKLLELELERQAHLDYLTGVSNRRYWMREAEIELQRSARYDLPMTLLMLDIDHFKSINDHYGHPAGDEVLKALAEVCRKSLRPMDVLGRLGGEEFAILLPETPLDQAMEVAERLRGEMEKAELPPLPGLRFTVSIGVAPQEDSDTSISQLLGKADKALYRAKANGRNRVCTMTKT